MNCKCYVYVDPDPKKTRIVHCPLHEAAPSMLEVLKLARGAALRCPYDSKKADCHCQRCKIERAITQAEQPFKRDIAATIAERKASALLAQAIKRWGKRIDDTDQDINGADAVEWLCSFIQDAQDIVRAKGFKGLLKRR